MTTHTPGPWAVYLKDRVKAGPFQYRGSIDGAGVELEEWEANAALIAAAPELLEVLKFAEEYLRHDAITAREAIRAAIAKAEGE